MKSFTTIAAALLPVSVIISSWLFFQLAEVDKELVRLRAMNESQASQILVLRKKVSNKPSTVSEAKKGIGEDFSGHERGARETENGDEIKRVEEAASTTERRVQAIGRVVDLTREEEEQLTEIYENEEKVQLDDVLGKERAQFIREQQRKAYSRAEIEDLERDAYYFTRKFNLNDEQEVAVFNILTEVTEEQKLLREESNPSTPQERMQLMLDQTKLYREILRARLKEVMEKEQYEAYLEYDNESTAADVELWH